MTIPVPATLRNPSQDPSANAGLISTPSSMTLRSLRGRPTRYTPPGIAEPVLPNASPTDFIHAGSAAAADVERRAATASAAAMWNDGYIVHLFV